MRPRHSGRGGSDTMVKDIASRKVESRMTTGDHEAPSLGRRALAVLSLLLTAVLVVAVIVFLAHNLLWLVVALIGLAVAVAGVWWVLTERMPRRAVGIAGLVVGAVVIVVALVRRSRAHRIRCCASQSSLPRWRSRPWRRGRRWRPT